MKILDPKHRPATWGFTLIELLTVISIIGVLLAMLVPAIAKAKEKAQIGVAKKDLMVIIGAINQYNATYNRLPAFMRSRDTLTDASPDFTYGTIFAPGETRTLLDTRGQPLPRVGNSGHKGRDANNSEVVAILHDLEKFGNGDLTVNANHALNPQKHDYLETFKDLDYKRRPPNPLYRGGGIGPDGVLRDPWGNPYIITMDLNYDNKCRDGFYKLDAVSRDPAVAGGNTGYNGLYRSGAANTFEANTTVMAWSFGPDGRVDASIGANAAVNKDNVLSWK